MIRKYIDRILITIVRILMNIMYQLKSEGIKNIPSDGGCILVCNHVSFIDPLLLSAAVKRPIRFVMDHRLYNAPVLHTLMKICGVIPIAPKHENPNLLNAAYEAISKSLANGDIVAIFPEGKITKDGEINEFRRGIEQIVEHTPVLVVPMAIRGMWGSFFSRRGGPAMCRFPRRFRAYIEVLATAPVLAENVTAINLRNKVSIMHGETC